MRRSRAAGGRPRKHSGENNENEEPQRRPIGTQRRLHVLADGRRVRASPAHPTADGRVLADLGVGQMLDGSSVLRADAIPYGETATWDILPSGSTGVYWANGIVLGSTLVPDR